MKKIYKILHIDSEYRYLGEYIMPYYVSHKEFKTKRSAENYIKNKKLTYVTILEIYEQE